MKTTPDSTLHHSLAFSPTNTIVCMSWEKPKNIPSTRISSFKDFEALVLTRFDVTTLAEHIDIYETQGVYKGVAENSALITLNTELLTLADVLTFQAVLLGIGEDLGQESILLRHNNENILLDCSSKKALTSGYGTFTAASDDDFYTTLGDIKFSCHLDF